MSPRMLDAIFSALVLAAFAAVFWIAVAGSAGAL